jgi:hypothetical protein
VAFAAPSHRAISTLDRIVGMRQRIARTLATRVVGPRLLHGPVAPVIVAASDEVTW